MVAAEIDLKKIQSGQWIKYWAGNWSLLSCSYFGDIYVNQVPKILGAGFRKVILVIRKGYSTAYLETSDRAVLGNALAKNAEKKPEYVSEISNDLIQHAEKILKFIRENQNKPATQVGLKEFIQLVYDYYPWHIAVKNIVDYIAPESLQMNLNELQNARVHSEPVFKQTEIFTEQFAEKLSEKWNLSKNLILCMTREELETAIQTGITSSKEVLEKRNEEAALVFDGKTRNLWVGKNVKELENALTKTGQSLHGACAFPGVVQGPVRIVLNPEKAGFFQQGDILVAEMTRPEYLPLMKKAAAVVTDAGGILCHAAIVAREMKLPTVIGTQNATKALKDGDWVQVDASKGTVALINAPKTKKR